MPINVTIKLSKTSSGTISIIDVKNFIQVQVMSKYLNNVTSHASHNRSALIAALEASENLANDLGVTNLSDLVDLINAAPWLGLSLLNNCSIPYLDENERNAEEVIRRLKWDQRFECLLPAHAEALCTFPLSADLKSVEAMRTIAFAPARGLKFVDVSTLTPMKYEALARAVSEFSQHDARTADARFGRDVRLASCSGALALAVVLLARANRLRDELTADQTAFIKAACVVPAEYEEHLGSLARDVHKQVAALSSAVRVTDVAVGLHTGDEAAATAATTAGQAAAAHVVASMKV